MKAVPFHCPHCRGVFQADKSMMGQHVLCPTCRRAVLLPHPTDGADSRRAAESDPSQTEQAPGGGDRAAGDTPAAPRLSCPLCGGTFQVTRDMSGRRMQCPRCRGAVTIPDLEPSRRSPDVNPAATDLVFAQQIPQHEILVRALPDVRHLYPPGMAPDDRGRSPTPPENGSTKDRQLALPPTCSHDPPAPVKESSPRTESPAARASDPLTESPAPVEGPRSAATAPEEVLPPVEPTAPADVAGPIDATPPAEAADAVEQSPDTRPSEDSAPFAPSPSPSPSPPPSPPTESPSAGVEQPSPGDTASAAAENPPRRPAAPVPIAGLTDRRVKTARDGSRALLMELVQKAAYGGEEREFEPTAEARKSRRRTVKNVVVWTFCVIVLGTVLTILRLMGPLL